MQFTSGNVGNFNLFSPFHINWYFQDKIGQGVPVNLEIFLCLRCTGAPPKWKRALKRARVEELVFNPILLQVKVLSSSSWLLYLFCPCTRPEKLPRKASFATRFNDSASASKAFLMSITRPIWYSGAFLSRTWHCSGLSRLFVGRETKQMLYIKLGRAREGPDTNAVDIASLHFRRCRSSTTILSCKRLQ